MCSRLPNPKPITQSTKNQHYKRKHLCTDCGKYVQCLSTHFHNAHKERKKVPCPQCHVLVKDVKGHIQSVHDKIPCEECGAMIGKGYLKRHIQAQHTPDNEKKYKCDVCGKGFISKQSFKDHQNVHTGEKPYKCKYCSSCFASFGTYAMHERGHVGRGRNYRPDK